MPYGIYKSYQDHDKARRLAMNNIPDLCPNCHLPYFGAGNQEVCKCNK